MRDALRHLQAVPDDRRAPPIERTRVAEAPWNLERMERLRRSGVSPRAARKPSLLDEWNVVRAAEHMIETHGGDAARIAEERAEASRELHAEKRWRAIAHAIREIGPRD